MRINILGSGITKFGELWEKSLLDLALEAANEALTEANLSTKQIDAVVVANMIYPKTANQNQLGSLLTSTLGIKGPGVYTEAACASGGLAVHQAILGLLSGEYETVLVIGAEKMTDLSSSEISSALMGAASEEERKAGLTFPALYALLAKVHMQEFKTTRDQLAEVAVKNHYHASLNPKAQFQFKVTKEKVLASTMIADPLTLFDSSPISDGAAALVLSNKAKSKVFISASAVATDSLGLAQRDSLIEIASTKHAGDKAFKQAGLERKDVNLLEVHDCFTIAEILALEDLGFCKKGEGGSFVETGNTSLGGSLPVNLSGGLKGCGHPVAATGIKQIIELKEQLEGKANKRQVKTARVGLAQNVGGTGATAVVHLVQI